ncbi:PTS sugar transporter subunit IIB [Schumannella luteola]|uniref:PTS system cellobiose-specific IIB component n=1 Tax=Schumannella luteola TaxID=472059 RepID=A0A852YAK8_9MICO|nr:PTS sugar transporter subunit IIB [Schumannella luteola]NYG98390.1 PTS system cellobiose-specific IIB component [Schumannella luteola]TPW90597.1 PTS sugar transporter subunit IIB [Schumannella luteola]
MKILLVCNAGMSTGILQNKLEQRARELGASASVLAVPLVEVDEHIGDASAVLLGPQIRFALDDISGMAPEGVPVLAISAQDFGMMNAAKVFDDVTAALRA